MILTSTTDSVGEFFESTVLAHAREFADMHRKEEAESVVFDETESVAPNDVPHTRVALDEEIEATNYENDYEDFTDTEPDIPHHRIPASRTEYSKRLANVVHDEWIYQDEHTSDKKNIKTNEIIIE